MSQEVVNRPKAAEALTMMMKNTLYSKFGSSIPPESYTTPTGIRHIDAILGSGIVSSSPIFLSSTPETGKSTIALFIAGSFLRNDENSMCVYIDSESTSNDKTSWMEHRIDTFGIDNKRFIYVPVRMTVPQVFQMIDTLIEQKRDLESKALQSTGMKKEYKVLLILDSITAVECSGIESAEDQNKIIGLKARELGFYLSKSMTSIAMNRVTFIAIDQVRANMKISGSRFTREESTVGDFGNFKSATNVNSILHALRQWIYLKKGKELNPNDRFRVDGWIVHVMLEKCKLCPGGVWMPLVLDKKFGPVPVLSEYLFLSEITKTEQKYWKIPTKLKYPLSIKSSGNSKILEVTDPETKQILYKSEKFTEKKLIELYNTDQEFHDWFDKAVVFSVQERIQKSIFRDIPIDSLENQVDDFDDEDISNQNYEIDEDTGEVIYNNSKDDDDD